MEVDSCSDSRNSSFTACTEPLAPKRTADASDAAAGAVTRLPREILQEVFSHCDFHDRHRTLPCVCRAWAVACAGPSPLWSSVDADVRAYSAAYGCTVDAQLLRSWLASRAGAIRSLSLRLSWVPAPVRSLVASDEATAAALILSPLLAPGTALAALRLTLPDRTPLTLENCSALAATSSLTRLELLGHASAFAVETGLGELCWLPGLRALHLGVRCRFVTQQTSSLASGLARLTTLTRLEVACPGADLGPLPADLTRLTRLQHLCLQEGFRPLWPLPTGLGSLPLRRLSLGGFSPWAELGALPDAVWAELGAMAGLEALELRAIDVVGFPPLSRLPRLQELTLDSCFMVGMPAQPPGLLAPLTALSVLRLDNCELDAVPRFVTGASALRSLSLAGNEMAGGMPAGDYLSRLTRLDLSGNRFGGGLPASLGSAAALRVLALEGNHSSLASGGGQLRALLPALLPDGLSLPTGGGCGHATA